MANFLSSAADAVSSAYTATVDTVSSAFSSAYDAVAGTAASAAPFTGSASVGASIAEPFTGSTSVGAAPTGTDQLATKIAGLPEVMIGAAKAISTSLIPLADSLLLAFATIMIVWLGIRMMIEKNQNEQIIIGEALKLLLLLGLARAILVNHAFLLDLLQQSANFISTTIGVNPNSVLSSMFNLLVVKPFQALWNGMPNILPYSSEDSLLMKAITLIGLNVAGLTWNLILYLVVVALGLFVGWLGLAIGFSVVLSITLAEILYVLLACVGVICIPFLLVPKLDKIFWSWVDGMLYAISIKLVIAGCVKLISAFYTANIPAIASKVHGIIVIDLFAIFQIIMYATVALALTKISYSIAGVLAGARLAIKPEISFLGRSGL